MSRVESELGVAARVWFSTGKCTQNVGLKQTVFGVFQRQNKASLTSSASRGRVSQGEQFNKGDKCGILM